MGKTMEEVVKKKNNKLTNMKTYYKTTIIKPVCCQYKNRQRNQWNRTQNFRISNFQEKGMQSAVLEKLVF